MPTLGDAGSLPKATTIALTDLVQVYKVGDAHPPQPMTVLAFLTAAITALPTTNAGASGTLYTNSGVLTLKP
jgi:hypothetical protein